MDYLYGHLANGGGRVGADPITVVSGIQQLNPSIADDVLTFLNKRVMVPDPVLAPAGMFSVLAVTMARFAELSYKTSEATKNAGEYITSLPKGNYALANVNDTLNLTVVGDFHFTVAKAEDVPLIAGPGSPLAILYPISSKAEEKFTGIKPMTLIGAAAGAGIGFLVAGVPGALIGGIGTGVLLNQVYS